MAKKIVKTFDELKLMNLSDVIEKECYLEFKHSGSFQTVNIHEQILELIKHFNLCDIWNMNAYSQSFHMDQADHFGPSITPFISQKYKNLPARTYWRNASLFSVVDYGLGNCEISTVSLYRDTDNYYFIVDDLKKCSVFFYNDNGKNNVKDYPIYRLLDRCNKRRLGEIKKEKNEKIRKFEMELVIMGLQGFLEIPSLSLEKTAHSNMAKTAFLRANGFTITANYKRDWDANLYDLTHYNNSINMKQLNHKDLKIILTALKEIGKL